MARPTVRDVTVYVPTKSFEISKRFYAALGFELAPGWGGTTDVRVGGATLRLQDYFVTDWAHNTMIKLSVDDVEAWHQLATEVASQPEFADVRVKPIEQVDTARVLHVLDPAGVLLVFVQ